MKKHLIIAGLCACMAFAACGGQSQNNDASDSGMKTDSASSNRDVGNSAGTPDSIHSMGSDSSMSRAKENDTSQRMK
ncbi:hypothetical protein DYU05_03845 [Mucilaginibacter terrenus]|uniref:Entericidin n=1 Tax=Mucilaginibacter terrenus TaxID=2482727 RepID=A0A3E2NUR9_9SPHI|nr:hypothetical protein [Mucilaginibacter terrenus]RFZ84748.1 hypothetical protein DYU05_03845 [Mucilaginibacter terrenus]